MSLEIQISPNTPDLWLGGVYERTYGTRREGWVLTEDTATAITLRQPHEESDSVMILANGWTGSLNSMRTAAKEAVRAGHNAVTFEYSNTGTQTALESNAEDMASVMKALPQNWEQRVTGLSMGGMVTIMAMGHENVPKPVSATLVASAGFLPRDPSFIETVQHLYAESSELFAHSLRRPLTAAKVGFAATRHIVRRPWAIGAEIAELTHGSIHEDVVNLKESHDAPDIHFAYGDRDRLIPPEVQEEGIVGMPFDNVWKYQGGHTALVFNPGLARQLFNLDNSVIDLEPLREAA
ncbi:MAG TPA: alpha/beta hydrolase [Candidatus Saccharimonadales bacterium]|nr:alpha/beta hydrolase [Candidatus Saccharimonadales bacterium]